MENFTLFFLSAVVALYALYRLKLFIANKKKSCISKNNTLLLLLPVESLEMWKRNKLMKLLDFSYEKGYEQPEEPEAEQWQELYRRTWLALYGYTT